MAKTPTAESTSMPTPAASRTYSASWRKLTPTSRGCGRTRASRRTTSPPPPPRGPRTAGDGSPRTGAPGWWCRSRPPARAPPVRRPASGARTPLRRGRGQRAARRRRGATRSSELQRVELRRPAARVELVHEQQLALGVHANHVRVGRERAGALRERAASGVVGAALVAVAEGDGAELAA